MMSDDNKSSAQGGEGSARRELGGSQSGTGTTGEYQVHFLQFDLLLLLLMGISCFVYRSDSCLIENDHAGSSTRSFYTKLGLCKSSGNYFFQVTISKFWNL